MRKPEASAAKPEDAGDLLETDDVNALGDAAREKARRLTGDRVYYGRLSSPDETEGYAELRLRDRGIVSEDDANVFVGEPDDEFDAYREVDVPVDVAVVYGDGNLLGRLDAVDDLSADSEVRAVSLVPDGRTTAFTDLKAVAAARLCLDVVGVRVSRAEVGDKLAQTALAYGTNDLGFVDGEGFDPELAAREAGFTPVNRADAGGYGV